VAGWWLVPQGVPFNVLFANSYYWRVFLLISLALLSCACICCPWFDPRALLISDDHPNPQVELLKSYVPAETLPTVNPDYFTYFGFRDWWRWPLVYPYSIHAIDTVDHGRLLDESEVTDNDDIIPQKLARPACGTSRI
jgi:hypothetical protein